MESPLGAVTQKSIRSPAVNPLAVKLKRVPVVPWAGATVPLAAWAGEPPKNAIQNPNASKQRRQRCRRLIDNASFDIDVVILYGAYHRLRAHADSDAEQARRVKSAHLMQSFLELAGIILNGSSDGAMCPIRSG
jgi:hypothetical protein